MWKIAPLLSSVMILAFCSGQAMAWEAYRLYEEKWAIECEDGTIHSYSGGSEGLSEVGPALCQGHGGVAGPNDDVTPVQAEPMEVQLSPDGQQSPNNQRSAPASKNYNSSRSNNPN